MKRTIWVFAGKTYYPAGGIHDLVFTSHTIKGALANIKKRAKKEMWDWYDIVNSKTGKVELSGTFEWQYYPERKLRLIEHKQVGGDGKELL